VAVTIRPASVEDVEGFLEMKNDAWRWVYAGILPDDHLEGLSTADQADGWRQAFTRGEPDVTVALDADRVVGVVSFGPTRDEDASVATGEIGMLYVAPDHVDSGLGRQLLDHAVGGLARAGFARATLWVLEANGRGRGFYEHMGWRTDGSADTHPIGDDQVPIVRYAINL
jgi:ribosomal protein S18 acetylase RimI-like enzyme